MPAMRAKSGYASTGGFIGLAEKRCIMDGALAIWEKSLGVGRMVGSSK